jgi:hypothetical protein
MRNRSPNTNHILKTYTQRTSFCEKEKGVLTEAGRLLLSMGYMY